MTRDRIIRIKNEGDVVLASRSGLALGRRAGLSLGRQFRLAGLIRDLGQSAIRSTDRALCTIKDESDPSQARVRVEIECGRTRMSGAINQPR
jgi:hypothetical protein